MGRPKREITELLFPLSQPEYKTLAQIVDHPGKTKKELEKDGKLEISPNDLYPAVEKLVELALVYRSGTANGTPLGIFLSFWYLDRIITSQNWFDVRKRILTTVRINGDLFPKILRRINGLEQDILFRPILGGVVSIINEWRSYQINQDIDPVLMESRVFPGSHFDPVLVSEDILLQEVIKNQIGNLKKEPTTVARINFLARRSGQNPKELFAKERQRATLLFTAFAEETRRYARSRLKAISGEEAELKGILDTVSSE